MSKYLKHYPKPCAHRWSCMLRNETEMLFLQSSAVRGNSHAVGEQTNKKSSSATRHANNECLISRVIDFIRRKNWSLLVYHAPEGITKELLLISWLPSFSLFHLGNSCREIQLFSQLSSLCRFPFPCSSSRFGVQVLQKKKINLIVLFRQLLLLNTTADHRCWCSNIQMRKILMLTPAAAGTSRTVLGI